MNEAIYYDLKQKAGLSPSLSSHVAREIGRRIVSQNYKPGELIEDENALAQRYRVSRSVVRDAVKILVGKGLLEVRRGIGTRVNPRHCWGLFDDDVLAWSQSAPADPTVLRKLTEIRQTIEPKAARWAAERGTQDDHAKIKNALDGMVRNVNNIQDFVTADAEFHGAILRATDNEFLMALEGLVFTSLLSSIRLTNLSAEDNTRALPIHQAVYEAIIARDGYEAEAKMGDLLADTGARVAARLVTADSNHGKNTDFASGVAGSGKVGSKS